ncbi:MAG: DUF1934 domain-containing protein [Oscillospiraceae bacterium]|jgi:uncharacterized beta-barrel protein YwiB (DUF1934 family)|nr:DUF1934 domain-containing protein [Oscillospiraceae bacterium]
MKEVRITIKGSLASPDSESDGFELLTDGEYSRENDISTFSYIESEMIGENGVLTTFNVEPDRVVLRRGSELDADMIFSEKQKHHFLYDTPFGAITMGINTHSIKKNMRDDGGHLEIRYDIQVDNIAVSSNLFEIEITSHFCPHMQTPCQ